MYDVKYLAMSLLLLTVVLTVSCDILLPLNSEHSSQSLLYKIEKAPPDAAAEMIESYAQQKEIGRDEIPDNEGNKDFSILIKENSLSPEPGIDKLFQSESTLRNKYKDGAIPAILQFKRALSLSEISKLYEKGIKGFLSNRLEGMASIIYFPISALDYLRTHDALRWLGEYKASYKVAPSYRKSASTVIVHPIDVDRQEYRNDLKDLSYRISRFDKTIRAYFISGKNIELSHLLNLRWVKTISSPGKTAPL